MKLKWADLNYNKFCSVVETRKLLHSISEFVVLFSGGKDCSMLLDLFLRYIEENSMPVKYHVFSVMYPKHMYLTGEGQLNSEMERIKKYWLDRGIDVEYVIPAADDFADGDRDGCRICKASRKEIIDPYIARQPEGLGILTGFTMYDALSYLDMMLLVCGYDLSKLYKLPEPKCSLTTKMLHKMSLREELPNERTMVRPILPFDEHEVTAYLEEQNIPYLCTPCKISNYKFKRQYSKVLNLYSPLPVSYDEMELFLKRNGIELNHGGLPFDDVTYDNYFIDC